MRRVFAIPNSGRTLRTPLKWRVVLNLLVAVVVVVVVAGLPVTQGQNNSLEFEHLPHFNDRINQQTNISQGFSSLKQDYKHKYYKCRCEGNQAWNTSGCVDTQTKVVVMKPDTGNIEVTLTDDFAGVTVRNVQCSWDHVQVHLDPKRNPTNEFTLFPNGTLSWHHRVYEHYCIEHRIDAEGFNMSWEAHVCLPPPAVPRCCLESSAHTQDESFSCSDDNSAYQFSPSIMINKMFVKWPQVTAMAERRCKQNEKVFSLPLNKGKAHLSYESGGVDIVWKTPDHLEQRQKEGFCVGPQVGGGYVATICQEDQEAIHRNLCGNATCVRKCCPKGELHLDFGIGCVAAEREAQLWTPYLDDSNLSINITPSKTLTLLYGWPHCSMYVADPSDNEDDKFYLLANGNLFTPATNEHDPSNRYCVDNFITEDKKIFTKALICFTEQQMEPVCAIAKGTVIPSLIVVSSIFLGVTLFIYLTVPDLRDKLHGRCLISLASAFFVAYVLMAISYFSNTTLPPPICSTLGKTFGYI